MNCLNCVDGSRKNLEGDVKQKSNHNNNPNQNSNISKKIMVIGDYHNNNPNQNSNISKKIMVIGDSMVKYLRLDKSPSRSRSISIMKHLGCLPEDMVDYVKPVMRKKPEPDILLIHVGTNGSTKGVNTKRKVGKCVEVIRELINTVNIQIRFSGIIQRIDKNFSNGIKETNIKLKNSCLGRGFVFIDNDNINEFCLNNSKLHLIRRGLKDLLKLFYHL